MMIFDFGNRCKTCGAAKAVPTTKGAGSFCVRCDRIKCGCGRILVSGCEKHCPYCGKDVSLANRQP